MILSVSFYYEEFTVRIRIQDPDPSQWKLITRSATLARLILGLFINICTVKTYVRSSKIEIVVRRVKKYIPILHRDYVHVQSFKKCAQTVRRTMAFDKVCIAEK